MSHANHHRMCAHVHTCDAEDMILLSQAAASLIAWTTLHGRTGLLSYSEPGRRGVMAWECVGNALSTASGTGE
jgi:hypothetical protein